MREILLQRVLTRNPSSFVLSAKFSTHRKPISENAFSSFFRFTYVFHLISVGHDIHVLCKYDFKSIPLTFKNQD